MSTIVRFRLAGAAPTLAGAAALLGVEFAALDAAYGVRPAGERDTFHVLLLHGTPTRGSGEVFANPRIAPLGPARPRER